MTRHTRKLLETRTARAGPPLPETLRLLAPPAPTLEKLNTRYNKLSGTIPLELGKLGIIRHLDLSGNVLSGMISTLL